jgi:hypothetical protein
MKFMLLQYYEPIPGVRPMSEWSPEEIRAHIGFQHQLNDELTERGELVDAQGLAAPAQAKFVTYADAGAPIVTDGPFPESKELLAGYRIVDVDSPQRAIEIAAQGSGAPGQSGVPIKQRIEVREIMGPPDPEM